MLFNGSCYYCCGGLGGVAALVPLGPSVGGVVVKAPVAKLTERLFMAKEVPEGSMEAGGLSCRYMFWGAPESVAAS
tara:strand:+ start:830 stop:1057 length:228 start_codon:yes stop_codon:yes gene_type:complete